VALQHSLIDIVIGHQTAKQARPQWRKIRPSFVGPWGPDEHLKEDDEAR